MMKHRRSIFSTLCILATAVVHGQGPNSAIAPDFVLSDIDGVERDMYSYLDQGKTVVLDMFATWCGPCANSQPGLQALWNAHGTNGDNTVMILGCELDGSTFDEDNWRSFFNITYPVIRAESLWNIWHPNVYPTFAIVCPDRSWHLVQQDIANNPAPLLVWINQCPHPTLMNDARAVDYRGPLSVCGQTSFTPAIRIQNLGVNAMTGCTIETWADGTLQNTFAWTGMLTQYQMKDSVMLWPLNGLGNSANLSFRITNVNGGADSDPSNDQIDKVIGQVVPGTAIKLEIRFDADPEEISWKLFDANGLVLHHHDVYDPAVNPPNSLWTETWNLNNQQCYRFEIDDYFGNGLCCSFGSGYYRLKDGNNTVFKQGGDFDFTDSYSFVPDATAGVNEQDMLGALRIFPNPSAGLVNIGPFPPSADGSRIEVFNALGARIPLSPTTANTSGQWRTIDPGAFGEGIYFLHVVAIDGTEVTKRMIVIR